MLFQGEKTSPSAWPWPLALNVKNVRSLQGGAIYQMWLKSFEAYWFWSVNKDDIVLYYNCHCDLDLWTLKSIALKIFLTSNTIPSFEHFGSRVSVQVEYYFLSICWWHYMQRLRVKFYPSSPRSSVLWLNQKWNVQYNIYSILIKQFKTRDAFGI